MPINNRSLGNGITLITEPVAATKAVAIGFWFSTGSRDEPSKLLGSTHFIEHMLFKGTETMSTREIARFFDRTGGYVNAFTERENVCLYAVVPALHLDSVIPVMIDMLGRPLFGDTEIEHERTVIQSEILSYLDDPEESCAEYFMERTYGNAGLGLPIAGTVESVASLGPDDLRSYYHGHFTPSLACVTVSGAFDGAAVASMLERYPYSVDAARVSRERDTVSAWHSGLSVEKTEFTQSQFVLGWKIPLIKTTDDWFAWSLINDILSDTVSSRLFQEIREERGLCYSISGSVNVFRDSSFLGVSLSTPTDKSMEAVESLFRISEAFFESGPNQDELEDAVSRVTGAIALASEDAEYRMKRLARQYLREGIVRSIERDIELVTAVGLVSLKSKATGVGFRSDLSMSAQVPGKYAKEFEKAWKQKY